MAASRYYRNLGEKPGQNLEKSLGWERLAGQAAKLGKSEKEKESRR